MSRHRIHSLSRTFAAPMAIAAVSLVGLVSALAGDGIANVISWLALAVPIVAIAWALRRRRH